MCENPLVILSQSALLHFCERASIYFYDNLSDSVDIKHCQESIDFLKQVKEHCLDSESIQEVVLHSYFYVKGKKFPLFCLLPCGKCKYCRYDYQKEIENRCIIEAAHSGSVIFYTLTYDDDSSPLWGVEKSHVSAAFKRLRTYIERYIHKDIHFTNLYVGEYATDARYSLRPHYHGILFFDKELTNDEFTAIRDLFCPHPTYYRLMIQKNPRLMYVLEKKKIYPSVIYELHPELFSFWPHGIIFDFQKATSPCALARYVSKYITKQTLVSKSFPILKERDNAHWNPMFIQMPKRIGLACRYIDEYKDYILNSRNMCISVVSRTLTSKAVKSSIVRVKIPSIYIRKLFPTIGQICPCCVFNAHLIKGLLDSCYNSLPLMTTNCIRPYLDTIRDEFEQYSYMCRFSLKKKEIYRLELTKQFIIRPYLKELPLSYTQCYNMISNFPKEPLYLVRLLQLVLQKFVKSVNRENFDKLYDNKSLYFENLVVPLHSVRDNLLQRQIKIKKDAYQVSKLLYSESKTAF